MNKKIIISIVLLSLLFCIFSGVAGAATYRNFFEKKTDVFKEFYDTENSVSVSPSTLRRLIDNKDENFVLVDLRSSNEYNIDHVVGAINIPIVGMQESMILAEFKKIPQSKKIIMYCYSAYCMLSRQAGQLLANNGIHAQHLNLGWAEWKYNWTFWNPQDTFQTGIKYIEKGSGLKTSTPTQCTSSDQFGC
jgi:rhodanese-related sulfurtransferase